MARSARSSEHRGGRTIENPEGMPNWCPLRGVPALVFPVPPEEPRE